jgi:hypothetical protein
MSVWNLNEVAAAKRARGEFATRGVPDAIDACRTPPRSAGPKRTTGSLFTLPPRDPQSFPMPLTTPGGR